MVWNDRVPILPAAREYVRQGIAPGGTHANMRFLADWVYTVPDITEFDELLLCDAQTSGGLLAAVPGDIAPSVVHQLHAAGATWAALIGSIEPGEPGRIVVRCAPQFG